MSKQLRSKWDSSSGSDNDLDHDDDREIGRKNKGNKKVKIINNNDDTSCAIPLQLLVDVVTSKVATTDQYNTSIAADMNKDSTSMVDDSAEDKDNYQVLADKSTAFDDSGGAVTTAKATLNANVIDINTKGLSFAIVYPPRKHNPLFDGCRSVDCYQRLNFIDQGTYGMVFKAKCRETNEIYALKQIKFGNEISKVGFPITALREINILLSLNHPIIVKVKEMVVGSSIDKIFMVMEYCENDLKTCMRLAKQSFSTAEIKQLMIQLLSAIEHMHERWYIHRDLKTSNLLYSNKGYLAVCDFGLARYVFLDDDIILGRVSNIC